MRPTLFSEKFGVDPTELDKAGLLDPYIKTDTPLFIDPLLIDKSSNTVLRTDGITQFREYFDSVVRLLAMSERKGDPAWQGAAKRLSLREPAENGLGYSKGNRAGTSRPKELRQQLLLTIQDVIRLGSKDPEMLSLMGFLEEGVGPDTISDFTTVAMAEALAKITHSFCSDHGIPMHANALSDLPLPLVEKHGKLRPMVLVPRDVLRDLPVTDNWGDVWEAAEHNQVLRDKLSVMLAGIAKPTVLEQKAAIRRAVTESSAVFDAFLRAVKDAASSYDPNDDVQGFYAFRNLLRSNPILATENVYEVRKNADEVQRLVMDALGVFQHHVENGNLWEALWAGNQPKRERAGQLQFFAIADAYCRAHGIETISEPNFGGGPVDFMFGDGINARVIVEMKKSTGTVESGYSKQLEKYKAAARTQHAIFVVLDYGKGRKKIAAIHRMRERAIQRGETPPEIVVIDARQKLSPSKLR